MFNQLVAEDKIVYDSKAFIFPYTLRFVASREDEEENVEALLKSLLLT